VNVIFTGTTGVRKRKVLEALVSRRAEALQVAHPEIRSVDSNDPAVRRFIRYKDVDQCYQSPGGEPVDVEAVLTDGEITQVRRDWKEAFRRAVAEVRPASSDQYLAVHATYFWHGRPSIPVDLATLAEFQPHAVVSLIDDCYSVWWRVKRRDEQAQRGSYLRLQDVLRWRQFDLWMVQQLVNDLSCFQDERPVPHYVLAVKHPVETLYRLLHHPACLRVYGAHPISDVRNDGDCLSEIAEQYQGPLRNSFTLLEPAAIDEKPLEFAFEQAFTSEQINYRELQKATVALRTECRIPVGEVMVPDDAEMFGEDGLELNAAEVFQVAVLHDKEGKSEIDNQILERDFWLVRMSHRVTGYRPYWSGKTPYGAQGVIAELNLGGRLHKLPKYVGLRSDKRARGASPLHDQVKRVRSVEELSVALEYDQQELRRHVYGGGS